MKKTITIVLLAMAQVSVAQNVGIGTNTPTGPLSFANTLGNKLVLFGDGNSNHYGIGVQGAMLQLYSDAAAANIGFGFGRSGAFNERARINNSGLEGMYLNGRLHLRNGDPANAGGGGGIWLYNTNNTAQIGFMGTQNNQNIGFFGGPALWGFTYDVTTSRVGIGNNSPNAPLAFGATLGKKITLFPGAQGDAGFGISANRLQIYADNSNADVAIGYDAAGVFNERFAVKPTGALAVNGNTGTAGQMLVSNGGGAPAAWVARPGVIFFTRSNMSNLDGSTLCVDINGINGQTFNLTANSMITYQFSIPLFASNGVFGGISQGAVSIQILNGNNQVVSESNTQYVLENLVSKHIQVVGVGDLPAGSYSVRARLRRSSTSDGTTFVNFGILTGCDNVNIYPGQLIIQFFPK
jgi:hypothetical protein